MLTMTKQACELRIWLRQPGHGHGSHGHGHGSHGSHGSGGGGGGGGGGENGSQWRGRPLRLQLPVGAGQISLADMDSDGLMDLVFLSPHPQGGARGGGEGGVLHVWYGALWRGNLTQADAEAMASTLATPGSEACRKAAEALPPEILCSSAEHARLAFVKRNWTLPAGWVPLDAAAAAAAASSSASSSSAAPLQRPPTLGVADFLSNGYPELLLPLLAPPASATPATPATGAASGAGSGADPLRSILAAPSRCAEGRPCIALLHNDREMRCSPTLALPVGSSTEDGDAGSLYGTRLYPLLSDTIAAAFFDLPGRLEDDSSLDILARLSSGGHKAWRRVVDSRANYDLKVEATPRATYYLLLTTYYSLLTTYYLPQGGHHRGQLQEARRARRAPRAAVGRRARRGGRGRRGRWVSLECAARHAAALTAGDARDALAALAALVAAGRRMRGARRGPDERPQPAWGVLPVLHDAAHPVGCPRAPWCPGHVGPGEAGEGGVAAAAERLRAPAHALRALWAGADHGLRRGPHGK